MVRILHYLFLAAAGNLTNYSIDVVWKIRKSIFDKKFREINTEKYKTFWNVLGFVTWDEVLSKWYLNATYYDLIHSKYLDIIVWNSTPSEERYRLQRGEIVCTFNFTALRSNLHSCWSRYPFLKHSVEKAKIYSYLQNNSVKSHYDDLLGGKSWFHEIFGKFFAISTLCLIITVHLML